MSGLVLSSIAGSALTPIDVSSLPSEQQLHGNVYNLIATVATTVQIWVVMISTFMLVIFYSIGNTPDLIYRALTYVTLIIGLMTMSLFIPVLAVVSICHESSFAY